MKALLNMTKLIEMSVELCRQNRTTTRHGFYSLEHFVLSRGVYMAPPQWKPERAIKGPRRECFRNAALAAMHSAKYIYCEGYASTHDCYPVPFYHAWLLDQKGNTIDPTWDLDGAEYVGIPILGGYLSRRIHKQETYGLIDRPEDKFQMLGAHPRQYLHPIIEQLKAKAKP